MERKKKQKREQFLYGIMERESTKKLIYVILVGRPIKMASCKIRIRNGQTFFILFGGVE